MSAAQFSQHCKKPFNIMRSDLEREKERENSHKKNQKEIKTVPSLQNRKVTKSVMLLTRSMVRSYYVEEGTVWRVLTMTLFSHAKESLTSFFKI